MDPKEKDGPKGNGQTLDTHGTIYWHGKTYGLEVDPWAAVEPVPYLCAVGLNSSDEEFSEPKRVSREKQTKNLPSTKDLHM